MPLPEPPTQPLHHLLPALATQIGHVDPVQLDEGMGRTPGTPVEPLRGKIRTGPRDST